MQAKFITALGPSCLALAACSAGAGDAPRWIRLATLPSALVPARAQSTPGPEERALTITTDEREARISVELAGGDWRRVKEGTWSAELPAWAHSLRGRAVAAQRAADGAARGPADAGGSPYRLRDEQGELELFAGDVSRDAPELPPRSFTIAGAHILVNPAGEAAPELVLEVREERGPVEEGARRFLGSRFSGEGLVVWPGEELGVSLELPPASALTFGLATEPRSGSGELAYRIELDGELLFEERVACAAPDLRWRTVALPAAGGPAQLAFSVRGPLAHTAFVAPTVGPEAHGAPGARPWDRTRPDVVVFVADTFRADNLAAYGGRPELAPFLNGLVERSLLFTRAWSTSTHTLAAHASLFTGLFPRQAGILGSQSSVSRDLLALAEFFAELGYRTGAVSDQAFVSRTYGMDQGFQVFDEEARTTFARTEERVRAFLEADDGRPVFLFVQTYRTHQSYEPSPEACAELGIQPLAPAAIQELADEYDRIARQGERSQAESARMAELAAALELQYRGTVRDLDRGFERIFRELAARGHLGDGYLVFTSDHGEAFGEHGDLFHGGVVHEEQVRIPLFLHGPELPAGRVERPASLVDLPATLARLAGAEPHPGWLGASLLESSGERAVYAFQSKHGRWSSSTLCSIEGHRKLIGDVRAQGLLHAYDLASDPGELHDLAGEAWAREMFERQRSTLEAFLRPRGTLTTANPTAEELAGLAAMGYAGDDD